MKNKKYNEDDPLKYISMAIDCFAEMQMFNDYNARKMQIMGYQGQKRFNQYNGIKSSMRLRQLQQNIIDCMNVDFNDTQANWNYEEVEFSSVKEYMVAYTIFISRMRERLNYVINNLNMLDRHEQSILVSKNLKCISKQMKCIKRWHKDFVNVDYNLVYFKTFDDKLHDKMKIKMRKLSNKGCEYEIYRKDIIQHEK